MFAPPPTGLRIPPATPDPPAAVDNGDGTVDMRYSVPNNESRIGLRAFLYIVGEEGGLTLWTTWSSSSGVAVPAAPGHTTFGDIPRGVADVEVVTKFSRSGVFSAASEPTTIPGTGPVPNAPASVALGPGVNQVTVTPGEPNMQTDVQLWYGTFEYGEIEYQSFTSNGSMSPVVITSSLFPEVNEAQARHFNGDNYSEWVQNT